MSKTSNSDKSSTSSCGADPVSDRESARLNFLAEANHDLRPPLHALSLFVSALKERARTNPDQPISNFAGLLDKIGRSQRAVGEIVENLLDFAKLDSGLLSAVLKPVQLSDSFDRIAECYSGTVSERGLSLIVCPSSAKVCADRQLLDKLLGCFVANAIRFTDEGKILIGARRKGKAVRIEVWDTGAGIAPACHAAAFEPFTRFGATGSGQVGLGLGLAIADGIAKSMGGEVGLYSEPGRGSCFFVSLPLADEDVFRDEAGAGKETQEKPLVLLVDDDPTVLDAMEILLDGWGYLVIAALSVDEMKQRLAEKATKPTLLIADFNLGGGSDGVQGAVKLKDEVCGEFPVAIMSGETGADLAKRAKEHGMVLLGKPVKAPQLHQLIRSAIAGALS